MLLLQCRPAVLMLHFCFYASFTAVFWLGLQNAMEMPQQSLKKKWTYSYKVLEIKRFISHQAECFRGLYTSEPECWCCQTALLHLYMCLNLQDEWIIHHIRYISDETLKKNPVIVHHWSHQNGKTEYLCVPFASFLVVAFKTKVVFLPTGQILSSHIPQSVLICCLGVPHFICSGKSHAGTTGS